MRLSQLTLDVESIVRGVLLAGFGAMIFLLIETGAMRSYINPAYFRFMVPAGVALLLLGGVQLIAGVRFLPQGMRPPRGRSGPSLLVYGIFTVTLTVGLTLSPVTLGADFVERQGFNLGQRARSGVVAFSPLTDVQSGLAWLGSAVDGLQRGAYAQAAGPPTVELEDPFALELPDAPEDLPGIAVDLDEDEALDQDAGAEGFIDGPDDGGVTGLDDVERESDDPPAPRGDRLVIDGGNFHRVVWDIFVEPERYTDREVELVGFISRFDALAADEFMVARLVVTCHIAHATPDGLVATHPDGAELPEDRWVRVTGVLREGKVDQFDVLKLHIEEMEEIPPLDDPYVYPAGLDADDFEF